MKLEEIKVLIACEESQAICKQFRALGVEAYSCDLQESSGGCPQWHIKGDCVPVIETGKFITEDGKAHSVKKWTLIIAHPPCTYLSNAGACHLWRGHTLNLERYALGIEGKAFFMYFYNLRSCDHVAIENPIPSNVYGLPPRSQIVQPYEYGHPYSKKTCLWLRNLPPLVPTKYIAEHVPFMPSGSYSKSHDPKYKGCCRKGGSSRARSKTFTGIAEAMAKQWLEYLLKEGTENENY